MAGSGNASPNSVFSKLGLKPVTKCTLVKTYIPALGVAFYSGLSVNVMNPGLVIRIFPKIDITNGLLTGALLGTGTYIYTREHMKFAGTGPRIAHSAIGAILFTLGSVLSWAIFRTMIPPNPTLCTLAGVGSGLMVVKLGSDYLEFVDKLVTKK